jgi:pterin-4a-carbinolamine dehydratase
MSDLATKRGTACTSETPRAVTFSTHAIGGLSENDFICAAKIEALVQR